MQTLMKLGVVGLLLAILAGDIASAQSDISPTDGTRVAPAHPTTTWHAYFLVDPILKVAPIASVEDTSKLDFVEICGEQHHMVITGSFFKNDENGLALDGLVISDGRLLNPSEDWDDGGFVWVDAGGSLRITQIEEGPPPPDAIQAIQSRPFIIENGEFDKKTERSSRWDRIGMGTANRGGEKGFIVVAVISDLSLRKAQKFSEFAQSVLSISSANGIEVENFLALDGAAGPFVSVRETGFYTGTHGRRYVSTVLCLS